MRRLLALFILNVLCKVSFTMFNFRRPGLDEVGPPEHVTDDRLFCLDQLPLNRYGETEEKRAYRDSFLPVKNWSYMNFTSLADLCSARGNPEANMGGIVWSPKLFHWGAPAWLNLANTLLHSASTLNMYVSFLSPILRFIHDDEGSRSTHKPMSCGLRENDGSSIPLTCNAQFLIEPLAKRNTAGDPVLLDTGASV